MLLYYDTIDQWPSVYKAAKVKFLSSLSINVFVIFFLIKQSCKEKESVLKVEQNQIVNLTITNDIYRELSGCAVLPRQSKSKKSTTTKSATTKITTIPTTISTKSLINTKPVPSTTEMLTTPMEFSTTAVISPDFSDVASTAVENFTETAPSSEEYESTSENFEVSIRSEIVESFFAYVLFVRRQQKGLLNPLDVKEPSLLKPLNVKMT